MQNYYRFHDDDRPSKGYFDKIRLSLILNSLMKFEKKLFFNELDSDHEGQEVEMNTSFEELVVKLQYIPPSLPLVQDDVPPSVNPPLLALELMIS